jgi:tungstate transport system permease protein
VADAGGELWSVVVRTLAVALASVGLGSVVGIPFGVWLGLASFRGRGLLVALIYAGMGLPPVVVGLFVYLLLSRAGPLAELDWLFTLQGMVLAQTLLTIPVIAALTCSAVSSVSRELPMQLRSLGASPWQARRAVLREARAGVLVAVAAGLGRSLSEVGAAMMVGGNVQGQTRVLSTSILLETGKGEFALALALGGWLLGLSLLLNLIVLRLHGRPVA